MLIYKDPKKNELFDYLYVKYIKCSIKMKLFSFLKQLNFELKLFYQFSVPSFVPNHFIVDFAVEGSFQNQFYLDAVI